MSERRLGEPIELPWWVIPMGWPPAGVVLAALVVSAQWWGRVVAVVSSLVVIWLMVRIARREQSGNMQSVWISTLYGLWVFFLLIWVAAIIEARSAVR